MEKRKRKQMQPGGQRGGRQWPAGQEQSWPATLAAPSGQDGAYSHAMPTGGNLGSVGQALLRAMEKTSMSGTPGNPLPVERAEYEAGNVSAAVGSAINTEQLRKWTRTLNEYKAAKKNLEDRIVSAEQFWKLRHWQMMSDPKKGEPEPASAWLVNTILSKHSDAMDAYPESIFLPREKGDKEEAAKLSKIMPVILQQNGFEQTWSDVWWYKLKSGTGAYGVFWDPRKLNGLGDITVRKVDLLNLFWEPGVADIQQSKYLFHVSLRDRESLEEQYPRLHGQLGHTPSITVTKYIYDDQIPTSGKVAVVDVYYHKGGKLHYCQYVEETVLYASEEDPKCAQRGFYDHGRYPFELDPLWPEEGYPHCGFGYVDLCKDPQKIIDVLNNAFVKSAVHASTPRWLIGNGCSVNPEDLLNVTNPVVKVTGLVTEENMRQIRVDTMPALAMEYMNSKINEIKEVSGNRDVNNGSTGGSVTAASAIAALQEAGNGLSRDMIASSYRTFRRVVELCVELIRQFYDMPRQFRILGEYGQENYAAYDNRGLTPQAQRGAAGTDLGMRLPVFDVEIHAQSESQYKKSEYNQLAIEFYKAGLLSPENAEQALMMLSMMDFKGRDELVQKIQAQATMFRQLQQYQQMALALAAKYEPAMAQGLAQNIMGSKPSAGVAAIMGAGMDEAAQATGENTAGEHWRVQKARQEAQDGSKPR